MVTARGDGGVLIGYLMFVVDKQRHYSVLQAMQDVVYLKPEHRGGGVGGRMLVFAEHQLRKRGVHNVVQHAKIKHPTLGLVLERMGYEPLDVVYVKKL